jgi:hypothetical protein
MNSATIKSKISSGQFILYRRVSTEKQGKQEYAHQLRCIQAKYPGFRESKTQIGSIKEVMSGCADAEVRMTSGLGKCLKLLHRNPDAVLIVSDADRIGRRADIFMLIQKQGFGRRVYAASTGLCVDQVVHAGVHHRIEKETEAQRASRRAGVLRRQMSGGVVGSPDIARQSHRASKEKTRLADEREAEALSVARRLVREGRGRHPSLGEICDDLTQREIFTGQGRFFTPERLSQLKKKNPGRWKRALDSYSRPRRRIRQRIVAALIEHRNRRDRRIAMRRLSGWKQIPPVRSGLELAARMGTNLPPHWHVRKNSMCSCRDGCRGPPSALAVR